MMHDDFEPTSQKQVNLISTDRIRIVTVARMSTAPTTTRLAPMRSSSRPPMNEPMMPQTISRMPKRPISTVDQPKTMVA